MPQDVSINCTILGCGTSVGVPALGRIGWGKCDPLEPKNRRQRCALLIRQIQQPFWLMLALIFGTSDLMASKKNWTRADYPYT